MLRRHKDNEQSSKGMDDAVNIKLGVWGSIRRQTVLDGTLSCARYGRNIEAGTEAKA